MTMKIKDQNAFIIGSLFLVAAVASIAGLVLYTPILNEPDYIINGSHHAQISLGAILEVITAFAVIGTAIGFYPILKPLNERMALAAVCFRLAEAIVIIVGILCLLTILTLTRDYASDLAPNSTQYLLLGKLLVGFHNWTFLYGPNVLLGPSTWMTAYLLRRAKLVPNAITLLGLIGGPAITMCGLFVTLGWWAQISTMGTVFAIPVFLYEMSLAVWLCTKGFTRAVPDKLPVQNLFKLAAQQQMK